MVRSEFQVFVKPAGAHCNLACSYCYYLDKKHLYPSSEITIMDNGTLEKYISDHIAANPGNDLFFSWHGGEPLLAGIDFFRRAVEYQKKYLPDGYNVTNGIQTNGTLIDGEWARFFSQENFYIGVSIDGPEEFHDRFRKYRNGQPSFEKAVNGLKMLTLHGVKTELLCVINSMNVKYPADTYRFLRSLGTPFITFLPLVERTGGGEELVSEISVKPHEFGIFLCSVFDEWLSEDIGRIKIQIIEEALRTAFDQDHTLCIFKKTCGMVPVLEHNGDFYSCDHYVDRDHIIGNINSRSLASLLEDERQLKFGAGKKTTLPAYCRECEVLVMCNGECPKNRFVKTSGGEDGLNYLCQGYRKFFNHIMPFVHAVRDEWLRTL